MDLSGQLLSRPLLASTSYPVKDYQRVLVFPRERPEEIMCLMEASGIVARKDEGVELDRANSQGGRLRRPRIPRSVFLSAARTARSLAMPPSRLPEDAPGKECSQVGLPFPFPQSGML
jgi:hypothetical protein